MGRARGAAGRRASAARRTPWGGAASWSSTRPSTPPTRRPPSASDGSRRSAAVRARLPDGRGGRQVRDDPSGGLDLAHQPADRDDPLGLPVEPLTGLPPAPDRGLDILLTVGPQGLLGDLPTALREQDAHVG